MTREQFETDYARRSGLTVEQLHGWGRFPERCDCRAEYCHGWRMGYQWEDAILEDRERSGGPIGEEPGPWDGWGE